MEQDLLSRVTGNNSVRQRLQEQDPSPRPPPSPALSLHLGSQEEPQSRADATILIHPLAPHQPHSPSPAAASLPTSARAPFSSDRLASVVVPGYPMSQRRHNLRAGAGALAQAGQTQTPAPRRPPTVAQVPTLQLLAGPTGPGEERCEACGLSAELLRGLSSDLDRARAQVALLTCQNESLRSRLKRAAAAEVTTAAPPVSSAHLDLRCGACRVRPATAVLVPREHLCLCGRCSGDGAGAVACPVCRATGATGPAQDAPR